MTFIVVAHSLFRFFKEAFLGGDLKGISLVIIVPDLETQERLCYRLAEDTPVLALDQRTAFERAELFKQPFTFYGIPWRIVIDQER